MGRNTIKRILQEQGIDPAPTRKRRYSWETFIRAHLEAIAAADFFTVEVMSLVGLVRTYVFFVIDIASRKVEIAGDLPPAISSALWQLGHAAEVP